MDKRNERGRERLIRWYEKYDKKTCEDLKEMREREREIGKEIFHVNTFPLFRV